MLNGNSFLEKLKPLIVADRFALVSAAASAFKQLLEELASATLELLIKRSGL